MGKGVHHKLGRVRSGPRERLPLVLDGRKRQSAPERRRRDGRVYRPGAFSVRGALQLRDLWHARRDPLVTETTSEQKHVGKWLADRPAASRMDMAEVVSPAVNLTLI